MQGKKYLPLVYQHQFVWQPYGMTTPITQDIIKNKNSTSLWEILTLVASFQYDSKNFFHFTIKATFT